MSLFIPPRPATAPEKRSTLTQRIALLRSGLGTFREGSYGQKMGRHGFRTLPFFKRRWIFTVRDPELVREVLVKRAEDFPKSGLMDAMLRALTGYSIFVSNGEVWGRQRRLVDPALEQARVRDVFARMLEASEIAVARMEALADTGWRGRRRASCPAGAGPGGRRASSARPSTSRCAGDWPTMRRGGRRQTTTFWRP